LLTLEVRLMSLLDYDCGDDFNTWNEYEKLDEELQKSLLEINHICSHFTDAVVESKCHSRKYQMAIGSAWIWWILAINLLWIQVNVSNCQRLRICAAPVSGE